MMMMMMMMMMMNTAGKVCRNTVGEKLSFWHIHPYFAGSIPDGVIEVFH